jgi:hypothetical protein
MRATCPEGARIFVLERNVIRQRQIATIPQALGRSIGVELDHDTFAPVGAIRIEPYILE